MAERTGYPQIPSTVWWGIRAILQKTPSVTVDERFLQVQLAVQAAAARQYLAELRRVGILTEEGKATDLAQRWRLDDKYAEAVEELVSSVYPKGLLEVAPIGEADRQKVVSWFMHDGLGQGSANNKAATYLLVSSLTPSEAPDRSQEAEKDTSRRVPRAPRSRKNTSVERQPAKAEMISERAADVPINRPSRPPDTLPLNVNVQIHISADAGSDQIEAIFSAMRRYLYDDPGT
ncbi:MAG: hypothetical protein AAGG65_11125 [Pseudomonadota bacterium]